MKSPRSTCRPRPPVKADLPEGDARLEFSRAQLAILAMFDEGDYIRALSLAEGLTHQLRVLAAEQFQDEAGVVKPE